ncbi:hypothetical protein GCM10010404_04090 [Nonomuraea africana]
MALYLGLGAAALAGTRSGRGGTVPVTLARGWVDGVAGPHMTTSPPRGCTRPTPSVTCRVCPTAWRCQAVREYGARACLRWHMSGPGAVMQGSAPELYVRDTLPY